MEPSLNSLADSPSIAKRPATSRSRVANGSAILPTGDGRSLWVRLLRDTLEKLEAHCRVFSETQRLAARRVSTLEAELVFLEEKFAKARAEGGEPNAADLDLYGRLADRQRRLAEPLGWHPPRPTAPPLDQYLDRQSIVDAEEIPP
jgi:hypothetical protein